MKRITVFLVVGLFSLCPLVRAEDNQAAPAPAAEDTTAVAPAAPVEPTPTTPAPPTLEAAPAPAAAPAAVPAAAPTEAMNPENLEFVSGEVASLEEASKSLTVKLYGETENAPSDKTLKVTVDENTDITDGEQDRDLKSLTAGTEVDVEYDPSNNKATYIFVY